MVAPTLTINAGVTVNAGVTLNGFAPRGNPTTPGISFALLNSMPHTVVPTVSLYKSGTGIPTIWQAVNSAVYPTPAGYTFSDNTQVYDYGANVSAIDPYTVIASGANESFSMARFVSGTIIGGKTMYSFILVNSSAVPEWDAIGLSTDGVNLTDYIGATTNSIGVYDNGAVYFGEYTAGSANGPTFESNGIVVDLLVDNQNQKMWYSVAGSAWIGNYTA